MICTCTGGLSSSLVSSRKQETATSCKACGGRPSVNVLAASMMMSTVGLELANSLNSDLAWKTVSKGYKRAPRRARKLVGKNFKMDMELVNKSSRRADDTAVSESEKLGVAVLGRRFSEKIEHVPIKKRRFMFRSPSPPPQSSSSRLEVSEQLARIQQASGQRSCPNSVAKAQLMVTDFGGGDGIVVTNENLGYIEDFSGIEILAAAACENSVGDDADHGVENQAVEKSTQEGIDSPTSASQLDETITSLEATNNSSHEDKINDSSFQDNKEENLCSNKDDNTLESSVLVRDDRLHWDLNVSMDDWEQPCDVDSQTKALENISVDSKQDEKPQVFEGCGVQRESENIKHDIEGAEHSTVDRVVSSDVRGDIDMPKDLRDLTLGSCRSNGEEHELQVCSGFDTIHDKCSPTIADNALESSTYDFAIIKASTQVISMDGNVDVDPSPGSDITNTGGSEKNSNTSFDSVIAKHEADVALPYVPVSKKATCEIDGTIKKEDGADSGTASALRDFRNSPQRIMSLASFIPSEPVSLEVKPVIEAAEVDSHHPECKCEDTSAAGASVEEGQPAETEDVKGQVDKASVLQNAVVDSSVHVESEELLHKCSGDSVINLGAEGVSTSHEAHKNCGDCPSSSSRKDSTGDPSNAGYDLDVSQVDKNHILGQENAVQLQAGYDSQYEDGELRESDVHYWEENEGDYAELECVDYESDNMDNTYEDAEDYLMSEKVPVGDDCKEERFCGIEAKKIEKNLKVQRGLSSGSDNVIERMEHYTTGDAVREPSVSSKTKTSGSDHLPGGCEISGKMSVEVSEGRTIMKHSDDYMDGLINDKDCPVRVVGPRLSMKDNLIAQRSRSDNFDFCTRPERDEASDHSIARDRSALYGRNPGGAHLINPSTGYWDSKRRSSPTYYDSYGSGRPRPKSVIESRAYVMDSDHTLSEAVGVAGVDNRVYRPPIRRRFPVADREEGYGLRRGMVPPVRDVNSDRRFRRYPPQGVNRGPRDEYHRPMQDDSGEYPYRMHPLPRRDNSISPPSRGRPLHYTRPYKKSQSRSRSRSPVAWSMPRERNEGSRHRSSRSPDYRFEPRMKRVRLPLQKPNFATDYEVGIMSPPRRRFSPKRNSRWFDDPNGGAEDHFRGRRLPMRTFRQNQRFDPPRRLDSDDYFVEPMIRPGRFVDMPGAGRGRRFEGSDDDRRKPGGRYEIIHRVRRYDTDGVVRRFRYDEEECVVSQNPHNFDDCDRGADNRRPREVPRRLSEDKGHLRYNHDRLFNSSPNSFGVQDQ